MKKILSVLLAIAMLIGCVSMTVATSAAEGLTAATVPAETTVTVYGSTNTFSVPVTIDEASDSITAISLALYADAAAVPTTADVTVTGTGLDDEATSVSLLKGTSTKGKKVMANFADIAAADYGKYTAITVDVEGEIEAPLTLTLTFTVDDAITSGAEVNLGVVALSVVGSDNETELDIDDTVSTGVVTFADDETFAALAAEYAETEGPVFVIEDVTVPYGTEYVDVRVFLLNNTEDDYDGLDATGIWGTRTYIEVPSALTLANKTEAGSTVSTIDEYTVGNVFTAPEFAAGLANAEISSNSDAQDAWDVTFGTTKDQNDYRATCLYFQSNLASADGTTLYNHYGNGVLITVRVYLPETYSKVASWDLLMAHWSGLTVKGETSSDTSDADNALVFPTVVGGTISIQSEGECDHANASWIVETEATCTATGTSILYCADCEETLDSREIPMIDHTPAADKVDVVAASCTEEGYTGDVVCSVCGNTIEEGVVVDKTAHTPGDRVITTPAAVGVEGAYEVKCTVCNQVVETGVIPAIVEAKVAVEDTDAEPTDDTITVPVTIADNEGIIAIQGTIDLGGLTLNDIEAGLLPVVDGATYSVNDGVVTFYLDCAELANLTEDGTLFSLVLAGAEKGEYALDLEIVELINVDGEDVPYVVTDGTVTVACNHTPVAEVTTPATIDSEGLISNVCTKCDEVVYTEVIAKLVGLVAEGEEEVKELEDVDVAVSIVNNPGVWSVGFTVTYDADAVEFVGITSGAFEVTDANYSVADGVVTVFVENDAIENVTEDDAIVILNFTAKLGAAGTDATFVVGAVEDNTINVDAETVAVETLDYTVSIVAHDHVAGEVVDASEATCTEEGYTGDVYCSICDELIAAGETIPMVDHTPGDAQNAVEATCTSEGYTGDVYCTVCDTLVEAGKTIPAAGHDFVDNYCEACDTGVKYDGKGYLGFVNGVAIRGWYEFDWGTYYFSTSTSFDPYAKTNSATIKGEAYEFTAEGVLVSAPEPAPVVNGIVDGVYYVDSVATNAGVVEQDGNYYYSTTKGVIVTGKTVYIYSSRTNGLITPGEYTADENGILTPNVKNGIVDGVYYVDNVATNAGLICIDGTYYYTTTKGVVVTDTTIYIYSSRTNGLLPRGEYTFGSDGALVD